MNKKLFLIPAAIAGMSLVACGDSKPEPTPVVKEYDVSLKMTEAMDIDNPKAISDTDYDAKITVKNDFTGYCAVPKALHEIHVNGVQLEGDQYTYTRDNDSQARLHIPSENVTGDIEIFAEAKADKVSITLNDSYPNKLLSIDQTESVVGSSSEINFSLTGSDDQYSVPEKLSNFYITCLDSHDEKKYNLTPCCTYNKYSDTSSKLIIPAKYNGVVVITGAITITASAYQPIYTIKDGDLENLKTDYTKTKQVNKGEDYSFGISAENENVLPNELDIKVGGTQLSKSAGDYTITDIIDNKSATITIKAHKVNDDIVVSGSAIPEPTKTAPVKYYLGGIINPKDEEAIIDKDFECKLEPEDGHDAPHADDIRVLIGDHKDANNWLIPNDGSGITFDEGTSTLKIPGSKIKLTSDPIHIAARADDVKLLEFYSSQGDWESIETAANMGYAEYLFEIGEESVPFTLNNGSNDSYRIRILGFNKDKNYLYENTSGITFEFTTGVSQQYFGKSVSGKTYSSYFYKKGSEYGYQCDLYDYLNTTLYNALPFKKYINNTRKYTVSGSYALLDEDKEKIMESSNYLFPLSLREMGLESSVSGGEFDKEGPSGTNEAYPYYANGGSLVKTDGTNPITYWLRSPANLKNAQIYTINTTGARASAPARGQKLYVAPAFCF